jgi:DNA-binding NarL/FixJ family response regulator
LEKRLTNARRALPNQVAARARAEGAAMPLEQAVELAMETLRLLAGSSEPAVPGVELSAGGLTGREWEVARAIASGGTNRQIAEQLVISPATVERHVSNILRKLDLASRSQLTAWVLHDEATAARHSA